MLFERIAEQVKRDYTERAGQTAEIVELGYLKKWSADQHRASDEPLKRYSTARRWEQYTAGEITREQAVNYAIIRNNKDVQKRLEKELARLEAIENAPELQYISIAVDWKRNAYWGNNPTATVNTQSENASGHASGCGYDKESSAVATALNQCNSVLRVLCMAKEKALAEGETDHSKTACTGHDNRNILGYGAGYNSIPYFEGGVGVSCFWSILKKCGYTTRENHSGKRSDFYNIYKMEV